MTIGGNYTLSSALYTVPCPGTSLEKAGNKLEKKMWRKRKKKEKKKRKKRQFIC